MMTRFGYGLSIEFQRVTGFYCLTELVDAENLWVTYGLSRVWLGAKVDCIATLRERMDTK